VPEDPAESDSEISVAAGSSDCIVPSSGTRPFRETLARISHQ
jgi:hypothetical protein